MFILGCTPSPRQAGLRTAGPQLTDPSPQPPFHPPHLSPVLRKNTSNGLWECDTLVITTFAKFAFQGWYQNVLLLSLEPHHLHCQTWIRCGCLSITYPIFCPQSLLGLLLSPYPGAAGLLVLEMNSLLTLTHFDVSQGSILAGGPPSSLKKTARLGPRLEARGNGTAKYFPFYGRVWLNLKTFQVLSQQPWSI